MVVANSIQVSMLVRFFFCLTAMPFFCVLAHSPPENKGTHNISVNKDAPVYTMLNKRVYSSPMCCFSSCFCCCWWIIDASSASVLFVWSCWRMDDDSMTMTMVHLSHHHHAHTHIHTTMSESMARIHTHTFTYWLGLVCVCVWFVCIIDSWNYIGKRSGNPASFQFRALGVILRI